MRRLDPLTWMHGEFQTNDMEASTWLQKLRGGEKEEIVYLFSFSTDKSPVYGKPSGQFFAHV